MNLRQAVASALHFFVVFALFLAGLFFVCLPHLPETRIQLVDLLSNHCEKCTQIGLGFFLTTFLFFIGFYALNRGRFLVVKMGVLTDLNVIRYSIEDCFARQFPKKISLSEIEIGRKARLDIRVSMAKQSEEDREALYIEVEKQLLTLLRDRFGYVKPFYLIVNV